ncbi:MAG: methyltransferase [Bacteroidota bacterium]
MNKTTQSYWENCYKTDEIGWDIGYVSPPVKSYFEQLEDKETEILLPGAGNAYEADYLYQIGFKNLTIVDIASQPLINIRKRNKDFPEEKLLQTDFFNLNRKYDLIIELIFFCALHPSQRVSYVEKMYQLLKPGGKIIGLLFDFPLTDQGPPYGGSKDEYFNLFTDLFKIRTLETCYNSIKPRKGRELFIIFEKKNY